MLGKPGKPLVELHPRLPILCLRTGHQMQREVSQLSVRFIPSVKLTSPGNFQQLKPKFCRSDAFLIFELRCIFP